MDSSLGESSTQKTSLLGVGEHLDLSIMAPQYRTCNIDIPILNTDNIGSLALGYPLQAVSL